MTSTPRFQRPVRYAITRADYTAEMAHRHRPLTDKAIGAMTSGRREASAMLSAMHAQTTDYFMEEQ